MYNILIVNGGVIIVFFILKMKIIIKENFYVLKYRGHLLIIPFSQINIISNTSHLILMRNYSIIFPFTFIEVNKSCKIKIINTLSITYFFLFISSKCEVYI